VTCLPAGREPLCLKKEGKYSPVRIIFKEINTTFTIGCGASASSNLPADRQVPEH